MHVHCRSKIYRQKQEQMDIPVREVHKRMCLCEKKVVVQVTIRLIHCSNELDLV